MAKDVFMTGLVCYCVRRKIGFYIMQSQSIKKYIDLKENMPNSNGSSLQVKELM